MGLEHLNPEQFGQTNFPEHHWGDTGYHALQRYVRGKNGKPYRLEDSMNGSISAHTVPPTNDFNKRPNRQSQVGMLTFFPGEPRYDGSNIDGGVIYKASVRPAHQRNGIASEMLDFARERYPEKDVRHSDALSEDGAAWAQATPTPNDVRRRRESQ